MPVRVGVSQHTEVSAELEGYFTHGLKKESAGYGLGLGRLGLKHQLPGGLAGYDTSLGFNASVPLDRPPLRRRRPLTRSGNWA